MREVWKGIVVLVALALAAPGAAQERWTVALTDKQAQALAEIAGEREVSAFAISPDGAWGRSWGYANKSLAGDWALAYCRAELRPRRRDCILYELDGARVAPATVAVPTVREVYKPLNGRKAAAVIGRVDYDFAGNKAAALAQLASGPARAADLRGDPALRQALVGRSIMATSAKAFAHVFEETRAAFWVPSNSGILMQSYDSWAVTAEGLVCMFNGRYASTGKPVATRCMILNKISNGLVDLSWSGSPNATRKGQLIAGDVRRAAVR
ncbi:MAG: hypothetical protein AAFQ19_16525 [Pseudomonadota bacterium]